MIDEKWVKWAELRDGDVIHGARLHGATVGSKWDLKTVGEPNCTLSDLKKRGNLEYLIQRKYKENEFGLEVP